MGFERRYKPLKADSDALALAETAVQPTGTPVAEQIAVWASADTLEGDANLTWNGATFAVGGPINIQSNALLLHSYTSSDTDLTGLVSGSSFGSLIEGDESAHLVIGIRDNDAGDSVSIVSGGGNYTTDTTYDTLVAKFAANGEVTVPGTLRLTGTGDASLSGTGHAFQSGLTSSLNIIIDNNEIMARSNGSASTLNLNVEGGVVVVGSGGVNSAGPVVAEGADTPPATLHSSLTANMLFLDGKEAIDGNDTWLRLNMNSDFASGAYTPLKFRADGGFLADAANETVSTPHFSWNEDTDSGLYHAGGTGGNASIAIVSGGGIVFQSSQNAGVWDSATCTITNDGGSNNVFVATSNVPFFPSHNTTASAANAFLNSVTGLLQRSTSSIKYKRDVRDLRKREHENILNLRPVAYKSKADCDGDIEFWGFIAEEVAQIEPALVQYKETEPDSVMYDRVIVGLLGIVKEHQKEIERLKRRIDN